MRVVFLTAVIFGILLMPLYAQTPEPQKADTMKSVSEPDVMQDVEKAQEPEKTQEPEQAEEPEKAEQMEEASSAAPKLSLTDMTFCTGVEDREPVSPDSTFTSDIGKVYCWTNIENDGGEGSVQHVWYYNGEEMARVVLSTDYPRNRVWSYKTILPEWKGQWKVAVMSGSEKLGEMTCTVE